MALRPDEVGQPSLSLIEAHLDKQLSAASPYLTRYELFLAPFACIPTRLPQLQIMYLGAGWRWGGHRVDAVTGLISSIVIERPTR